MITERERSLKGSWEVETSWYSHESVKFYVFIFLAFWAERKNDETASRVREGQWKPSLLSSGYALGPQGRFSLTLPRFAGRFIPYFIVASLVNSVWHTMLQYIVHMALCMCTCLVETNNCITNSQSTVLTTSANKHTQDRDKQEANQPTQQNGVKALAWNKSSYRW